MPSEQQQTSQERQAAATRPLVVLDPTAGGADGKAKQSLRNPVPRLASLDGLVVGLVDISKPRGDLFLDRVEELLHERGAKVARFTKPTFAKPAPVDLRNEIASTCDAVIQALAD